MLSRIICLLNLFYQENQGSVGDHTAALVVQKFFKINKVGLLTPLVSAEPAAALAYDIMNI
jgi:hypothetical protein